MGGTASSSLVEVSARDSGVWSSVYVVNIRGGYAAGSIWVATVRPLRSDMEVDQVSPFRHTVDMGLLSRFQSGRDLLADLSALNTKHVLVALALGRLDCSPTILVQQVAVEQSRESKEKFVVKCSAITDSDLDALVIGSQGQMSVVRPLQHSKVAINGLRALCGGMHSQSIESIATLWQVCAQSFGMSTTLCEFAWAFGLVACLVTGTSPEVAAPGSCEEWSAPLATWSCRNVDWSTYMVFLFKVVLSAGEMLLCSRLVQALDGQVFPALRSLDRIVSVTPGSPEELVHKLVLLTDSEVVPVTMALCVPKVVESEQWPLIAPAVEELVGLGVYAAEYLWTRSVAEQGLNTQPLVPGPKVAALSVQLGAFTCLSGLSNEDWVARCTRTATGRAADLVADRSKEAALVLDHARQVRRWRASETRVLSMKEL
jgi:hypothetical protein